MTFRLPMALLAAFLTSQLAAPAVMAAPDAALLPQPVDPIVDFEVQQQVYETKRLALIGANLPLAAEEAAVFWPEYKAYRFALQQITDRRRALVQSFAANFDDLTDQVADNIVEQALRLDVERVGEKRAHFAALQGELPSSIYFRYYQMETKLEAEYRFGWTRSIPLAMVPGDPIAEVSAPGSDL